MNVKSTTEVDMSTCTESQTSCKSSDQSHYSAT